MPGRPRRPYSRPQDRAPRATGVEKPIYSGTGNERLSISTIYDNLEKQGHNLSDLTDAVSRREGAQPATPAP